MPSDARPPTTLRSDARRNEERLLVAARDCFVEHGANVPLEDIAKAADIGIGTLYRRFRNRRELATAVVRYALTATAEAANAAAALPDPAEALARYMHAVIDLRTSAVIPQLLEIADVDDPARTRATEASLTAINAIVKAGHDAGALRRDVTTADISLLLVRLSGLVAGLTAEMQAPFAHRHADIVLAGLTSTASTARLGGPELTIEELRSHRAARK